MSIPAFGSARRIDEVKLPEPIQSPEGDDGALARDGLPKVA
jgi:hypothetical protein